MPIEPEFRDDEEFLPLQASDMLAWLWRRGTEYGPNSFDWLASEFKAVEMSPHSTVFSAKKMMDIVGRSFDLRLTPEEIAEYKKRYNLSVYDTKSHRKTPLKRRKRQR
jgi:hypothetical protein